VVLAGLALDLEADSTTASFPGHDDSPVLRNRASYVSAISLANDDGNPVENGVVRGNLRLQPVEGVCVALDLIADQTSVYYSDICPAGAMHQSEFVEDEGIRRGALPRKNLSVKALPDFPVVHILRDGRS
jgi:hypothetical protein